MLKYSVSEALREAALQGEVQAGAASYNLPVREWVKLFNRGFPFFRPDVTND